MSTIMGVLRLSPLDPASPLSQFWSTVRCVAPILTAACEAHLGRTRRVHVPWPGTFPRVLDFIHPATHYSIYIDLIKHCLLHLESRINAATGKSSCLIGPFPLLIHHPRRGSPCYSSLAYRKLQCKNCKVHSLRKRLRPLISAASRTGAILDTGEGRSSSRLRK